MSNVLKAFSLVLIVGAIFVQDANAQLISRTLEYTGVGMSDHFTWSIEMNEAEAIAIAEADLASKVAANPPLGLPWEILISDTTVVDFSYHAIDYGPTSWVHQVTRTLVFAYDPNYDPGEIE